MHYIIRYMILYIIDINRHIIYIYTYRCVYIYNIHIYRNTDTFIYHIITYMHCSKPCLTIFYTWSSKEPQPLPPPLSSCRGVGTSCHLQTFGDCHISVESSGNQTWQWNMHYYKILQTYCKWWEWASIYGGFSSKPCLMNRGHQPKCEASSSTKFRPNNPMPTIQLGFMEM